METVVSKKEFLAAMAKTKIMFIMFGLAIVAISLIFGRFLVRRLVRNIETAAEKVRAIRSGENAEGRLKIDGNDEVAYLTQEFDGLLDKLEESQSKVVEAEKIEAKVQIAREVAHNIRSPIVAIEMMLPMMASIPSHMKSVLKNSVKEIKSLAERLKAQADSMTFDSNERETMYLPIILKDLVAVKQLEYSARTDIQIIFEDDTDSSDSFVAGCSLELKSILSNLVNNAVESYNSRGGAVVVRLSSDQDKCSIFVEDTGVGIPDEHLSDIGLKPISFKGSKSRGLGLTHAYKVINEWGGKIFIDSAIGSGTTVRIDLQKSLARNDIKLGEGQSKDSICL